jgi:hypothetical protein
MQERDEENGEDPETLYTLRKYQYCESPERDVSVKLVVVDANPETGVAAFVEFELALNKVQEETKGWEFQTISADVKAVPCADTKVGCVGAPGQVVILKGTEGGEFPKILKPLTQNQ